MTTENKSVFNFNDNSDFDDSDDASALTYDIAKRYKLRFGKYTGKRLAVMMNRNKTREYLRYLLTWSELRAEAHANIKCCIDEYEKYKELKAKQEIK